MKKRLLLMYELTVIIIGIGLPLSQVLIFKPAFPPLFDFFVFLVTAIVSALVYITLRNTIISFEIVIYYFLLLVFGGNVASCMAIVTLLIVWTLKSLKHIPDRTTDQFWRTIKTGSYNAGVYGLMYLITGLIITYYPINSYMILAIPTVVILNEVFFSAHTFLKGEPYATYLKHIYGFALQGLRTRLNPAPNNKHPCFLVYRFSYVAIPRTHETENH
jgi:hypothetical protein